MWGNESFGGGGGFVPSDGKFNSPATGDKSTARVKRTTNIFPVTIRQILESPEEVLKFGDIEVSAVKIVGLVKSVEDTSTKITYVIEDQTGSVEAICYVGSDDAARPFPLEEGTYGKLVGTLRTTKGTSGTSKYLIVYKAVQVLDMNEVTVHGLEVLRVPISLRKLRENQATKINSTGKPALANSMIASNNGMENPVGTDSNSAWTSKQNMVFRCIQSVKGEQGVSVDQVMANLKGKMSTKDIQDCIDFLSGEGHIYSTTDDNHYKATDW